MIRYTWRRKKEIVMQALGDPSKAKELAEKHNISSDELGTWCDRLVQHGARSLRATHVQDFRGRNAHV